MAILSLREELELNYEVDGQGPMAWLLFNGATLPLQFWDPVAQGLAGQYRVVRFDQRNVGATQADGSFSLLDIAADAAELLDYLKIERAIIAGNLWGGRVAQVFARDYPHRVAGLVLCGTGGQFPAKVAAGVLQQMAEAGRQGDRTHWEQALEAAYCSSGFSGRNPEAFRGLSDLLWSQIENRKGHQRAKWDGRIAPSSSYWGCTQAATLLIYGTEDGFGTRENAEDLAGRIPGACLHFIDLAGHFVIREQPAQVIELMRGFADSLAETSSV
jgi:3-oxoadipate enol-lactonase